MASVATLVALSAPPPVTANVTGTPSNGLAGLALSLTSTTREFTPAVVRASPDTFLRVVGVRKIKYTLAPLAWSAGMWVYWDG